ncbi:MAG: EAL domain-containing protein [Methylophaga sp.]|nr:EAL domain-containing protein [Methylophaga sp.]
MRNVLMEAAFNCTDEGIIITDEDQCILEVNEAVRLMTGFTREELLGKKIPFLSIGESDELFSEIIDELSQKGIWQGCVNSQHKNGDASHANCSVRQMEFQSRLFFISHINIPDTRLLGQATDRYCQYRNEAAFNRTALQQTFDQLKQTNKHQLAICFFDLDDFISVNQQYGTDAGEHVLAEIPNRIHQFAKVRMIHRYAGDEFVVLLGDIHDHVECERALERIQSLLSAPITTVSGQSIVISASIGYTLYPEDKDNLDTLIRHADQAMLNAKMDGKGKYCRYDTSEALEIAEKNQQRREIATAIDEDQLELFFQPKIRLSTGKIFGFEALIRWRHPERGLLTPDKFINVIYDTDLEVKLGNWVIQRALETLSQWQNRGWQYQLSINLSAGHLCFRSFFVDLEEFAHKYADLVLSRLQIEILESNRLSDLTLIGKVISKLASHYGISTALDDFGTGYSSLTHIRNLPVSLVKIDQLFVRQMLINPEDCKIVEGVIALAQSFNVTVLAEGVESIKHGEILLAMGCDLAQGYAIAKPMPMDLINLFLNAFRGIAEWTSMRGIRAQGRNSQLSLFYHYTCFWLEQLDVVINHDEIQGQTPPILNPHLCHCGIWLDRARQQELFDNSTLAALAGWHEELHRHAQSLLDLQQHGKVTESRQLYLSLQANFNDILEQIQSIIR